ncbi:MAG: (Fe-S)-binding protein [Terriglobia bacterium]
MPEKQVEAPIRSNYGPGEAPSWEVYSRCIHCGLCLNSCPTYRELGLEMDSPRGRIYQMIQVESGRLPLTASFIKHIDLCLDCRACETACPSGVEYGRLVETARGQIDRYGKRPLIQRLFRNAFLYGLLPHRSRLELVGKLLRFYQSSGAEKLVVGSGVLKLFPGRLAHVARLAPRMEKPFFTERLGTVVPAAGERRYRVAFFAGCIANLAFARLNDATVRVLALNGCEVVIPEAQGCCGALHVHAGARDAARDLAKRNIETFMPTGPEGFDAIITNAAGCGSVLKEYPLLFEEVDREWHERAVAFQRKMQDVTEFLAAIDLNRNLAPVKARATYQDPCHLGHAQRIRTAPRRLLAAVPGLQLVELKETEVCCGSAGIYNVVHNEMAERLLAAKMQRIDETGADLILTANPGCLLQLRAGVARSGDGKRRRVMHVVELLDESYQG